LPTNEREQDVFGGIGGTKIVVICVVEGKRWRAESEEQGTEEWRNGGWRLSRRSRVCGESDKQSEYGNEECV